MSAVLHELGTLRSDVLHTSGCELKQQQQQQQLLLLLLLLLLLQLLQLLLHTTTPDHLRRHLNANMWS